MFHSKTLEKLLDQSDESSCTNLLSAAKCLAAWTVLVSIKLTVWCFAHSARLMQKPNCSAHAENHQKSSSHYLGCSLPKETLLMFCLQVLCCGIMAYLPMLPEKVICYAVFWRDETNCRKLSLDAWELWLTLGGTESVLNPSGFNKGASCFSFSFPALNHMELTVLGRGRDEAQKFHQLCAFLVLPELTPERDHSSCCQQSPSPGTMKCCTES